MKLRTVLIGLAAMLPLTPPPASRVQGSGTANLSAEPPATAISSNWLLDPDFRI